jgi:hypothetical protein
MPEGRFSIRNLRKRHVIDKAPPIMEALSLKSSHYKTQITQQETLEIEAAHPRP